MPSRSLAWFPCCTTDTSMREKVEHKKYKVGGAGAGAGVHDHKQPLTSRYSSEQGHYVQGFHRDSRGKTMSVARHHTCVAYTTKQASIGCLSQTRCTFSTASLYSRHSEVLRSPCARFNSAAHTQQKQKSSAAHGV